MTDVTGVLGPCSYLARVTKPRKFELYQEHTRYKVRRRFTLLVTACFDGTTGQAPTLLVVLVVVRCPLCRLSDSDNGCLRDNIKMLNGSVDDLRRPLVCTHYLHVG